MPLGIHSSTSLVPRLPRRGDAGRPGADPDVPTARADVTEAQGCWVRRHFVSHTAPIRTISLRISRYNKRALFPPHYTHRIRRSAFPREFLRQRNSYLHIRDTDTVMYMIKYLSIAQKMTAP